MSDDAAVLTPVLEGVELHGSMNVDDTVVLEQIAHNIRLGHTQLCQQSPKPDRVVLVGGGPSLKTTEAELVALVHQGAKLVTTNGAYRWCLERNLKPNAQILLDARPGNAKFLEPDVPGCRYYLASQCHPSTFAAVQGREHVAIWHSIDPDGSRAALLDAYYLRQWQGITGGTTVITRAIGLLRTLGYLRFDLFGVDSCWLDGAHHAFAQPENDRDKRLLFTVHPTGAPEKSRQFWCAPWHVKQFDDFLQFIRTSGQHFALNVHGEGLIAYALQTSADLVMTEGAV